MLRSLAIRPDGVSDNALVPHPGPIPACLGLKKGLPNRGYEYVIASFFVILRRPQEYIDESRSALLTSVRVRANTHPTQHVVYQ